MISIFNLGAPHSYRVPDGGPFGPEPDWLYVPTAQLVMEIVSPDDETSDKLALRRARSRRDADR